MIEVPAEVEVVPQLLEARTHDLSNGGVLLLTDGQLTVRVRFEVDGVPVEREARLVRSQPLAGGQTAVALHFVDPLEGPDGALPS